MPDSAYCAAGQKRHDVFIDSLVAPLSLVNALIVAVSRRMNTNISDTFRELEKIWAEYGVYENAGHLNEIVVIGGGAAGMMAALSAAQQGAL